MSTTTTTGRTLRQTSPTGNRSNPSVILHGFDRSSSSIEYGDLSRPRFVTLFLFKTSFEGVERGGRAGEIGVKFYFNAFRLGEFVIHLTILMTILVEAKRRQCGEIRFMGDSKLDTDSGWMRFDLVVGLIWEKIKSTRYYRLCGDLDSGWFRATNRIVLITYTRLGQHSCILN